MDFLMTRCKDTIFIFSLFHKNSVRSMIAKK